MEGAVLPAPLSGTDPIELPSRLLEAIAPAQPDPATLTPLPLADSPTSSPTSTRPAARVASPAPAVAQTAPSPITPPSDPIRLSQFAVQATATAADLNLPPQSFQPVDPLSFSYLDQSPVPIEADFVSVAPLAALRQTGGQPQPFTQIPVAAAIQRDIDPDQTVVRSTSGSQAASPDADLNVLAYLQIPQLDVPSAGIAQDNLPQELLIIPGQIDEIDGAGDALPLPTGEAGATPATDLPTTDLPTADDGAIDPSGTGEVVELTADRQRFDSLQQVFTGEGSAVMRFRGAVLEADRVQVNLPNRIAVAEGNVRLTRGDQVLQGDRFNYNFVQGEGTVQGARGDVFLPAAQRDFSGTTLPTDVRAGSPTSPSLSDTLEADQPTVQNVTGTDGITVGIGVGRSQAGAEGMIRRLRFEADEIDFYPEGWTATNVRITNDPFSPPELELRANRATFTRLSPTQSEIRASRARLVIDQGFTVPLLRSRVLIDSREREPALLRFGFDQEDRGGLFVEGAFTPISEQAVSLTFRPQFYLQRAFDRGKGPFDPAVYGVVSELDATLGPNTSLVGDFVLTSFDLDEVDDNLRASLRLRQRIWNHTLSIEGSYRDRLFNGSLGFQNVQSSIGFVFSSPIIPLGDTGIDLSYQAGIQRINANIASDRRADLLPPPSERENNRATLTRYQASAALRRNFTVWTGQPLPATPDQGLRYTPSPVVPFVQIFTGVTGIASFYSSGDTQPTLTGTIGVRGQFGHFSRPMFDYLGFSLAYSQTTDGPESPFNFDRQQDRQVLTAAITTQIYGPVRAGFRTSINLDTDRDFDTDYIVEYRRRTFGVILRYNPQREVGSIGLQISDFNWTGETEPFSGSSTEPRGVRGNR